MATQPVLNGLDTIELCPLKWLILCYVIFTWAFKKNEEHVYYMHAYIFINI